MLIKKRTITLSTLISDGVIKLQDGDMKASFTASDHQAIGRWIVSRAEMVSVSHLPVPESKIEIREGDDLVSFLENKMKKYSS